MPIFAGLVTGSASALTSYLSSSAHGMVVHVKKCLSLSYRLWSFEYKLETIWNMQTTYDTAKLKQAPGMVVHCERGRQLHSNVYRLHLLTRTLYSDVTCRA